MNLNKGCKIFYFISCTMQCVHRAKSFAGLLRANRDGKKIEYSKVQIVE